MREELVIEKNILTPDVSEYENDHPEVIRIPLSEEHVEFTKKKVTLEDVCIYKQQVENIIHIEENLKVEKAKVKISGSPRVIDESRE